MEPTLPDMPSTEATTGLLPASVDLGSALTELGLVLFVVAAVVGLVTLGLKHLLVQLATRRPGGRLARFVRSPWADACATLGNFVWGAAITSLPGVLPGWVPTTLGMLLGVAAGGVSGSAVVGLHQGARAFGNGVLLRIMAAVKGPSVGPGAGGAGEGQARAGTENGSAPSLRNLPEEGKD